MNDIFKELEAIRKEIQQMRMENMKRAMKEAEERKDHECFNNR